jgi:hypothetical protein
MRAETGSLDCVCLGEDAGRDRLFGLCMCIDIYACVILYYC